ncbi:hypothetical protein ILUMI_23402 [Ignelater luminosus]|uniref:Mutator-like transposase domain-containing protein n=1 Tax=Ignelater luminosus TaxID=2038154 RepID=A0A8K0G1X5_IGNLU|nr:hypothetical protein ILUMI_23402 [Ignelater luminosus]
MLTKEIRSGLKSDFTLKYINAAAVSAMVTTGGGFSQTQEICAAINMPCMSNKHYIKIQDKVIDIIIQKAWTFMQEVGREEFAKKYGKVDKDGIPVITVAADGAWCRRQLTNKKTGREMFASAANDYGATTSNMVINKDVLKTTKQEFLD